MNINILVVDDDEIFNQIIYSFLQIKLAKAISVFSLQQAREYLSRHLPDLIILDNYLSDGIGFELLEDMQRAGQNIPVMLITADEDQDLMVEYFKKGVTEYILKPLNLELMWLKLVLLMKNHNLHLQVIEKSQALQKLLDEIAHEQQLARYVYEHMTDNTQPTNGLVNSLMRASTTFNGDILLSARAPNGNVYTLLLDATGHGLAAAISVLPLVSIFRTMVQKSLSLAIIVFELNQKLAREMPDDRFVAAILLEIDPHQGLLNIWNGGMPDVLLLDQHSQVINQIISQHMPLGILDSQQFSTATYSVKIDLIAQLLMFSDGLIEQVDDNGACFGMPRVIGSISDCSYSDDIVINLERDFDAFLGTGEQGDDISICHINIIDLLAGQDQVTLDIIKQEPKSGSTNLTMGVMGQQLSKFDLLGSMDNFMRMADVPIPLRQRTFTICSELFCNALDHGVLGLDSAIKNEEGGFMRFYEEKGLRMERLNPSDKIELNFNYDQLEKNITICVTDSGAGFNKDNINLNTSELSGRGLMLIEKLANQVHIQAPGNSTSVVINASD
ncbi:MAG: response regulator of citrate/malate metabolism [Paraglaciecola sp.]|jgi:response regulator of citrate/malate metabolism